MFTPMPQLTDSRGGVSVKLYTSIATMKIMARSKRSTAANSRRCLIGNLLIGLCEDVRLAWIALTFNACDDVVTRADDMATFAGINPTMLMHSHTAIATTSCPTDAWVTEVTNYIAFPSVGFTLFRRIFTTGID
jgi:hypothetical protein